ncbi:Bystin [Pleurostoma richardsiae]|uniref:Bystin n=1 Tax=Pleurostoma richardsiae TaxID=41990 RepID=A0AA38RFR9_9PEZI|nr:Bystin [Pleurostoma richardsiae]
MPKATTPSATDRRRHNPLEADMLGTGLKVKSKQPKRKSKQDDEDADRFIDSKASRVILQIGQELIEEERRENATSEPTKSAFDIDSRFEQQGEDLEEAYDDDDGWHEEDEEVEEVEVGAEDLETFNKFLASDNQNPEEMLLQHWGNGSEREAQSAGGDGVNLADLIMQKIQAFEAAQGGAPDPGKAVDDWPEADLPPKVVEVYTKVGMILSRWRSGPLPKPAKILPTVPQWERILEVTRPDQWTPNAVYALTRIFISGSPLVATRWVEMVLLDRVREDIMETKKLNPHLYNALKKSLYKPAAFFKGFLFPLVGSGCTLREAQIVSSVLARVSVPVLHSAAAIKGLTEISAQQASSKETRSICSLFLKCLLDKGYALPYQVIDSLVFHFLRFSSADPASMKDGDSQRFPVIFYQSMLSFAARYKNDISEEQRESLLDALLIHPHPAITPSIRTELLAGRGRGVPVEPQGPAFDGDDTMLID